MLDTSLSRLAQKHSLPQETGWIKEVLWAWERKEHLIDSRHHAWLDCQRQPPPETRAQSSSSFPCLSHAKVCDSELWTGQKWLSISYSLCSSRAACRSSKTSCCCMLTQSLLWDNVKTCWLMLRRDAPVVDSCIVVICSFTDCLFPISPCDCNLDCGALLNLAECIVTGYVSSMLQKSCQINAESRVWGLR